MVGGDWHDRNIRIVDVGLGERGFGLFFGGGGGGREVLSRWQRKYVTINAKS